MATITRDELDYMMHDISLLDNVHVDSELAKKLQYHMKYAGDSFSVNTMKVFKERYAADGETNPIYMYIRVARALSSVEPEDKRESHFRDFLRVMFNRQFIPAGRTLSNAGVRDIVSNCIVLHFDDTLESIYQTLKDAVILQKWGSGLGFPFHLLRPAGQDTKSAQGMSSGPVSFIKVFDTSFGIIKQQGRHGANMAIMRIDHPDILEFIHCKEREGDIRNFNISVAYTDEFMRRATDETDNKPWYCTWKGEKMLPRRIVRDSNFAFVSATPVKMSPRQILEEISKEVHRNGEPGHVFIDTANSTNPLPHLGPLHATNPCGEQFLHDGDVCNLGSINFDAFVVPYDKPYVQTNESTINAELVSEIAGKLFDLDALDEVTRIATRMLDNVIDLTHFKVDRVNTTIRENRRIGLGIFGLADALFHTRIPYSSSTGRVLAEFLMNFINTSSTRATIDLAAKKGEFPSFSKSIFRDGPPRRNSALLTIAPTGTISNMFDISGGLEPRFALSYYYDKEALALDKSSTLSHRMNKYFRDEIESLILSREEKEEIYDAVIRTGSVQNRDAVKYLSDYTREVFACAMDMSPMSHIMMQADLQPHVDNSISKTVNLPEECTPKDIFETYAICWELKLKGGTLYRNNSRKLQVLRTGQAGEECAMCVE